MAFECLLPSTDTSPKSQNRQVSRRAVLERMLLQNLSLSSWLLIGALLQSITLFLIPSTLTFVPTLTILIILITRLAQTLLITYNILPNPYLSSSIPHRVAAQVPNADGTFSSTASSEPVVCFHLGAKLNHPLGIFSPHAKQLGDYFSTMAGELDSDRSINGYLGGSSWTTHDALGATETNFIAYFRSIESIHAFAYGPTHKRGWEWWNALPHDQTKHIGINHEIFAAAPGQWEAIYINFQPTLLGATSYLRKGDKLIGGTVEDKWVNALVDARKGVLRSSAGRLGRQAESLHGKYDYVPSEVEYEKA